MSNFLIYLYLCFAWGGSWVAIKISHRGFPPFWGAGLRFILAFLFLLMLAKGTVHWKDLHKREKRVIFATAFLTFCVGYGAVYLAEWYLPASLMAIFFATFPIQVALLSGLFFRTERLTLSKFIGVVLGFFGVVVLSHEVFAVENIAWLGMFLALLSPFACAINLIIIKKWAAHLDSFTLNLIPMLLGGTFLLGVAMPVEGIHRVTFRMDSALALVFLALISTALAFYLYYILLKRVSLVLLASIAYVTPVVAFLFSLWLLHEKATFYHLIGMALIFLGIALVQRGKR